MLTHKLLGYTRQAKEITMGLFRLKVGSHVTGAGDTLRFYDAADPLRNIVDTGDGGQDLAKIAPEKFEKWEGAAQPLRNEMQLFGEVNPPPPPTHDQLAEAEMYAMLSRAASPAERAQKLRQLADQLEQRGQGQFKTSPQSKEAFEQSQNVGPEGPLSIGQRWGQHESAQLSQDAPQPKAPRRSESPVPGSQRGLPPEKEDELMKAIHKEQQEGIQDAREQRRVMAMPGEESTPATSPVERARIAQSQQGQQQPPQGQQPPPSPQQQGQPQQQPQGQQQPPRPQAQTMSKAQASFKAMPPDKQRSEDQKLESLNTTQLRALADEEEVDVPGNASKAQLIQAIRQARKS